MINLQFRQPYQKIFSHLQQLGLQSFANVADHAFDFYNTQGEKVIKLGLPLVCSVPRNEESFAAFTERNRNIESNIWLMLVQAGEAALGFVENGELVKYKVIRKYMVRKKQGKAQILHLNTKGKSKAGSRIRLAQTNSFFNDINTKLNEWKTLAEPELLVLAISPSFKSIWQESEVKMPFAFADERIRKANWTIGLPKQNELKKANWQIHTGRISIFDPSFQNSLEILVG